MSRNSKVASRVAGEQLSLHELMRLAYVRDGINLVGGVPDFPAPPGIKAEAQSLIASDLNQYAVPHGCAALRRAIATKYRQHYGLSVEPDAMVTITCGATEGLAAVILALIDPGDEVILFEPGYDVGDAVRMAGGVPVYVPLRTADFAP